MRIIITISLILFLSVSSFCQIQRDKTIFNEVGKEETTKIIFSVSTYDNNLIGQFKDDLSSLFKGKILRAHYDDNSNEFTIVYNEFMPLESFIYIFKKYNIDYLKKKATKTQLQTQ